ncbi:hypothetical protein [Desnuesiella massiliensis]|uniref:hypothetical protein n=1 Tax=Desnuesiella massiliensis TaxID=1650662 RepID=UPI0006E18A59|nr:hypothetical protein [Desnuesiella massiliensis]
MVLRDEKKYIIGSNVLSPNRDSSALERERYKELERAKQERNRRIKQKQRKRKLSVIQVVALVFISGITLVWRDAKIYNMQKNLATTKREIETTRLKNEALKVDLLKVSSIEYVKTQAEKNLNMVEPQKNSAMAIDLSKDNFDLPKENTAEKNLINNFIDNLKRFLF